MTSIDMHANQHQNSSDPAGMPVAVQVLSTIFFGVFGILAVIFAFNHSLVGGIIVATIIGWRGGFAPGHWGKTPQLPSIETVMSLAPEAEKRSSGNASFDAYRTDTLRRLEEEQTNFENFLGRLRAAKDKSEFDEFLERRAQRVTQGHDNDGWRDEKDH
ncbi:MAG: DUF2852 domain-containing protein [Pseudomonadota bacterium]